VNDAKDRVEDAWQWTALRGTDVVPLDTPTTTPGIVYSVYELPVSADNNYIIKGFLRSDTGSPTVYAPIRQITKPQMIARYAGGPATPKGIPQEVAVVKTDAATGNIQVAVYPEQEVGTTAVLYVERVAHQPTLVNADDKLLVPSLPVYTLATALASRERGEVGGTPTSELFAIAERHLSDKIAQDSSFFPDELIWYGGITNPTRTNHRDA
jgi:hypothetical protein